MEWPKWLDDFPYEEPGLDDKKRRKWLLSTKLLLVSAVLGMLAGLDELRSFPVIAVSNGTRVALTACFVLLALCNIFRLGCYAAWRRGREIKRVCRLGMLVWLAVLLPTAVWMVGSFFTKEAPKSPVSDRSYTYQSSPLAAFAWGGDKEYEYQIVDVKAPLVYDLCLDMYTDNRHNTSSEWEPCPLILGARALYGEARGRDWLALWEDRIIWVSFDQPSQAEELAALLERLNAWER